MKVRKQFIFVLLFILLLFILLSFFSCNKSDNIKGSITLKNNSFNIKTSSGIYDIQIKFETKVSMDIDFIDGKLDYKKKFENTSFVELFDIDLGKYYIKVTNINTNGIFPVNYNVKLIKKNYWYKSRYESEPNDTFEIATNFVLSNYNTYSKTGRFSRIDDIDYYAISNDTLFDINCYITISAADDKLKGILYDENRNFIANFRNNFPFKLQAGKKYFLKLNYLNSEFFELPYIIIIRPVDTFSSFSEFEPNNDENESNKIILNQLIYGEINEDDIDFFFFDIEKDGFYKILFSCSSYPFNISLISDFGTFYGEYQMHRAGSFRHLLLPKGRYYLKLIKTEKAKTETIKYSIKVESDSEAFEIEPNDTQDQANEFTIFDNVTGSISWEFDVDYFFIQLEKSENYITITNLDPLTELKCEIIFDNNQIISYSIKGDSQIIKINNQKVILRLSSVNFSREIAYTIKVGN